MGLENMKSYSAEVLAENSVQDPSIIKPLSRFVTVNRVAMI